ncbi:MAG: hypothetical protein ACJA0N_002714 [Pseudohongiellaceae bacterium]
MKAIETRTKINNLRAVKQVKIDDLWVGCRQWASYNKPVYIIHPRGT